MLISSEVGAGEIVSALEETRFYDDVGCLAADWARHHPADARAFVRVADGQWRDASAVAFAQPLGARTAMGSGVEAQASIADAQAADRAGRALTFADLVRLTGATR